MIPFMQTKFEVFRRTEYAMARRCNEFVFILRLE